MRILSICTILCATASFALAESTTKGGYIACETRNHLDEMKYAAQDEDSERMSDLLMNGCFITNPGFTVIILEKTETDKLKIRITWDSGSVDLWTYEGNINL